MAKYEEFFLKKLQKLSSFYKQHLEYIRKRLLILTRRNIGFCYLTKIPLIYFTQV